MRYQKTCERCGSEFETNLSVKRFCKPQCKRAAEDKRRRDNDEYRARRRALERAGIWKKKKWVPPRREDRDR